MADGTESMQVFDTEELVALARLDLENRNVTAALVKLKQVLAGEAVPSLALAMTARIYAQLGLPARAQPLFEQYLASTPEAVNERFQLGMTYLDTGEPQQAMATWEALLTDHPLFPPALFYRGLLLAQQGHAADAKASLARLLETAMPDNLYYERAQRLMGQIEQKDAQGNDASQELNAEERSDQAPRH